MYVDKKVACECLSNADDFVMIVFGCFQYIAQNRRQLMAKGDLPLGYKL